VRISTDGVRVHGAGPTVSLHGDTSAPYQVGCPNGYGSHETREGVVLACRPGWNAVPCPSRSPKRVDSVFQAFVTPSGCAPRPGQQRRQIPRHTDSEIKIFSYVASRFTNQPPRQPSDSFGENQVFPNVRGAIHLYTNNIICPSCAFVIGQFRRMFPNVEVTRGRAQPHRPRRTRERSA
jgi:hypothetical protein